MIIGIAGKAQSGKNTVGRFFTAYGFEEKSFAYKVKQVASLLTGYPVEAFESEDIKSSYLDSEWNNADGDRMRVREMLQKIGTDCMRENLHENVWVNALFADYKPHKLSEYNPSRWVITDVRFPNEVEAIKERGGFLIKVHRNRAICNNCSELLVGHHNCPKCGSDQLIDAPYSYHVSETALDDFNDWDVVIDNNCSIDTLARMVKTIYTVIEQKYGRHK